MIRNGLPSFFIFLTMVRNGILSCFIFHWMVQNGISSIFSSTEQTEFRWNELKFPTLLKVLFFGKWQTYHSSLSPYIILNNSTWSLFVIPLTLAFSSHLCPLVVITVQDDSSIGNAPEILSTSRLPLYSASRSTGSGGWSPLFYRAPLPGAPAAWCLFFLLAL